MLWCQFYGVLKFYFHIQRDNLLEVCVWDHLCCLRIVQLQASWWFGSLVTVVLLKWEEQVLARCVTGFYNFLFSLNFFLLLRCARFKCVVFRRKGLGVALWHNLFWCICGIPKDLRKITAFVRGSISCYCYWVTVSRIYDLSFIVQQPAYSANWSYYVWSQDKTNITLFHQLIALCCHCN